MEVQLNNLGLYSIGTKLGKPGQIYLLSYNSGDHWMLSIVDPDQEIIYFMDPSRRWLVFDGEWKSIVNTSIRIFNAHNLFNPHKYRRGRKWKSIQWKILTTCGYWIMRCMKEIVEDKDLDFADKWKRSTQKRGNLVYTDYEIDEVRVEWAQHVMKFANV
ncbi:PREDICTED: uncharacterized protein LOC101310815 [Fragaria vesca subsp. vesca]